MNAASASVMLYAWVNGEWETITFTGSTAVLGGDTSAIEIEIPWAALGDRAAINLAVLSTGRNRTYTAGDILGTSFAPAGWSDALVLDAFFAVP